MKPAVLLAADFNTYLQSQSEPRPSRSPSAQPVVQYASPPMTMGLPQPSMPMSQPSFGVSAMHQSQMGGAQPGVTCLGEFGLLCFCLGGKK